MKKALLFGLMLFGATAVYADDAQNALQNDLSFDLATSYSTSGTISVSAEKIDNTRNGSSVIYCFTSPAEGGEYNVTATWGGKYDAAITMNISDDSENFDTEKGISKNFTGSGTNYDASTNETWGTFSLTANTTYYLKVSFTTSKAYAGNIYKIALAKYDADATRYTLTTSVNNADWGTVSGNNEENYVEGSTVTLTATPTAGYRFVQWNVDGDVSTDNPLNVTMNSDITTQAVFEAIPDALQNDLTFKLTDYYSTSGSITINGDGIGATKNKTSVIYRFSVTEADKYDVVAKWSNKYDTTITMNISTDPETFSDETAVSVNMTATGAWDSFTEGKWSNFDLKTSTTYYLKVSFATSSGWAGNINYIALAKSGTTGIDTISAVQDVEAEYFNLQGIRVDANSLGSGIYIKRQGNVTSKIVVR